MIRILLAALAALLALPLSADAAPYQVGDKLTAFQAADQHGQAFECQPSAVRFLIVTHDMETGKAANAALEKLGADYLPQHKAVYLSNIHGMPGVGRMFALPKMRKYPHRIILCDDAALIARFPAQAGKATVLALHKGAVRKVSYWNPAGQKLEELLR